MTIHERVAKMPQIDPSETVYALTIEDALSVIENNLSEEELSDMSDLEIDLLVQAVVNGFDNIDWLEWGEAALENFKWDNPKLLEVKGGE